jgi:LuxR family transcriptional regulator, maltose regulon positive regulatory protein
VIPVICFYAVWWKNVFAMARFGTAASPAVSAGTVGLAPRRSLFEWRGKGARVAEVTAPSRSRKTLGEPGHETGEMHIILAALRLAQDDPLGATAALAPVLDGPAVLNPPFWLTQAFVLEAIARDALGDTVAAERALERALELAELDGIVWPFILHPVPELLERQRRHRTAHAALFSEIFDFLAGTKSPGHPNPERLSEPLTESEIRVLRFLPTNLTQPEIAEELSLSVNTINTHIRHLYTKLAAHRRGQAVERARGLGLLAPSLRRH